jgi:hypothetical protein
MSQNENFQNQDILPVKHIWVWIVFAVFFSVVVAHSAMAAPLDDAGYTRGEVELSEDRAPSSIAPAVIALTQPSKVFYGQDGAEISPDLIANYNAVKASEKPLNMCDYVPTDMTATASSGQVFSRIADKTASTIFSSDAFRAMPIGSAATSVEKSMKTDVVLGGDAPDEIQHKFNFNLEAFQALAKVQYSGIANAAIMYYALQSKLSFEVSEKIFGSKDLVFNQDFSHVDTLSRVSFRWGF